MENENNIENPPLKEELQEDPHRREYSFDTPESREESIYNIFNKK
jgi:hypothetical protein